MSSYLDFSLCKNEKFLSKHKEKKYKHYNFNYLYPIENDKVYKKDKLYTITIRTIDQEVAEYLLNSTCNHSDENIEGIKSELKILPKKYIEKIYSITPVLIKDKEGYWRKKNNIEFFEKRLKENIIKKYKYISNNKEIELNNFYNEIKFKNYKPIKTSFKNINLLGDKVELSIESDLKSQELAYMILGMGLLENNSRGMGFVNFKHL